MTYPLWPKIEPPHPDAVYHFVIAPTEPEATMTEDELAALEIQIVAGEIAPGEAIATLIAEVRRLRVALDTADDSWAVSLDTVIGEQKREIARLRVENASLHDHYYDYDPSE